MKRKTKFFLAIMTILFFSAGAIFAAEEQNITEVMSELVLQIGIVIFAVRLCGMLVKKIGIPSVLGELLAGVIIGPHALGSIALPGFPQGLFPLHTGSLAVSPELYGFATVASIILLFASGLETDLGLFLRYSVAGGVVGLGGVIFSFVLGDAVGIFLLHTSFMDPRCLFLGILSTATSVGITARILSDQKKMDSPEGVTTLAAAVFDDVLGIICLAVVLGIVSVMTGAGLGGTLSAGVITGIAAKAFGLWLGFTALGLIFYKHIANFLKFFKHSFDFSICALGIALLLAGFFEKQGLAMIIGAYVTGLSLSKTDIATVIQERIHGLYEFFVPLFFAVMGMMVNVKELLSVEVLTFGLIYTVIAVLAKVVGCALPSLALGFNPKGALRIGLGMIPRGEVALIIAGIGISAGILTQQMFGVAILMTLATTLVAPPLLSMSLKIPGRGTRKETKSTDTVTAVWEFHSDEIADLVIDTLLKDLKSEGFYVQMMNIDDGLSQARLGDIALSITEEENKVTIETAPEDIAFVKTSMYEVIVKLNDAIEKLKKSSDPMALKKDIETSGARANIDILKLIDTNSISTNLKGTTKKEIITELVNLLEPSGLVRDKDQVLEDVLNREKLMSTGMQHGIALPHGKTDGITSICIAIGIKKEGIDFDSLDNEPSKLFILVASPKKDTGPHVQFLASISAVLKDTGLFDKVLNAQNPEEVKKIIISHKGNK